jgi:hypothetical protein
MVPCLEHATLKSVASFAEVLIGEGRLGPTLRMPAKEANESVSQF